MTRTIPIQVLPGCRGRITAAELRRVVNGVLAAEKVDHRVEVSVVLAGNDLVRDLNRLYGGKDEPTDVLSFGQTHDGNETANGERYRRTTVPFVDAPDETPSLGEVVICIPVAEEQAASLGVPVAGTIGHLLVHALLHLLGYDHEASEAESELMKAREDELLVSLGYEGQYQHGH